MKKRGKAKSKGRKARRSGAQQQAALAVAQLAFRPSIAPEAGSTAEGQAHRLPVGLSWNTFRVPAATAYGADERQAIVMLLAPILALALSLAIGQAAQPIILRQLAAPLALQRIAEPHLTPVLLVPPPLTLPTRAPFVAGTMPELVGQQRLALLPPALVLPMPAPTLPATVIVPEAPFALPASPPVIAAPGSATLPPLVCVAEPKRVPLPTPPALSEFGLRLAQAAQSQTDDFVIYSATYKRITFPGGDIPSLYGSCSDLVVRAYRSLGIDLQELVQRARVGSGDSNIDHRRTETLRAFFSRFGEIIPPSNYGEDYKPGDIVTYFRPYSRVSRAHIAIVSGNIGASGRPMIVHNRGWGPQLEDALFVDRMTGHYRFSGAPKAGAGDARTANRAVLRGATSLPGGFSSASTRALPAKRVDIQGTVR